MREDGGYAFPRPPAQIPNGGYEHGEIGMSYRDWLVGKMMIEWWAKTTTTTPQGQFYMALAGDQATSDAVLQAHGVVDAILKERYK